MIGIGVMGSNLLLNLADHGYAVIGYDLKEERARDLEAAARAGTTVKGTTSLEEMIRSLRQPRKIMMLVPAGAPVDAVIESVAPYLDGDDILIDGGNSFFKDTERRIANLHARGIHFFGMGVSGGEMGARLGPSMMPGGDAAAWKYLQPLLESIAARADDKPCVAYMGKGAAGHYVKMVHNGIEYAMMQLIAEVYDLLRRGAGQSPAQLHPIFLEWNRGQLQSFLIEVTAEIFRTADGESDDPNDFLIDKILDQAGSKGTGKWTSQEAMDLPVPVPTIDMAVAMRDLSVYRSQRLEAAALYKPRTAKIACTPDLLTHLENALTFAFTIAYAQGLSMLAKASEVRGMEIPLPQVVDVWRAGCIIRSALLGNFGEAFSKRPQLPNLLLDEGIAEVMVAREESMRQVVALGANSGIPMAAMSSALAYYDAMRSESLPINLVQAQRDFFGAHTYRRTDREGVFHTDWEEAEG